MSLRITLGPMYSGKTSKLIDTYFREGLRENKSLVIDFNMKTSMKDIMLENFQIMMQKY